MDTAITRFDNDNQNEEISGALRLWASHRIGFVLCRHLVKC